MIKTKIRKLRENTNLTQKEVAKFLGVTHTAVGKWESGKGMPRASMLPMIAYLYHCTVDDLYDKNATKSCIARNESRVKKIPRQSGA